MMRSRLNAHAAILFAFFTVAGIPRASSRQPVVCTVTATNGQSIILSCTAKPPQRDRSGGWNESSVFLNETFEPRVLTISRERWPERWSGYAGLGYQFAAADVGGRLVAWYRITPDCEQGDIGCFEAHARDSLNVDHGDPPSR
ncbi:MAG TPA: hypothetical protein VKM94_08395 [Blastocatellia bacterium]|nr:hypothetical protein [Blastocatellia bacterium]